MEDKRLRKLSQTQDREGRTGTVGDYMEKYSRMHSG